MAQVAFRIIQKDKIYLKHSFASFKCGFLNRLDTINEDSSEILKKIKLENQLPYLHITNGQSSDKTVKEYFAELGNVSNNFEDLLHFSQLI